MNHSRLLIITSLIILVVLSSCSSAKMIIPTAPSTSTQSQISSTDPASAIGLLGAYDLTINTSKKTAELNSKRMSSIGESYIVSGMSFFTVSPCTDCFRLAGLDFNAGNVSLLFHVKHPFQPGNPANPPTAKNRLDLDLFDLAILVHPLGSSPRNYPNLSVSAYEGIVTNPDGYTRELSEVITDNSALPYVLVVDDSKNPASTFNKFAMGDEVDCRISLYITPGRTISFEMFLTMGYGSSATKPNRMTPKYYNPEFNRKAAWKVAIVPPYTMLDTPGTGATGELFIWDWQQGATVYSNPADFPNAPTDNIYENSDVDTIDIEIVGLTQLSIDPSDPDHGTGAPNDPLTYKFVLHNENSSPAGIYPGIVKVADKRQPKVPTEGRDFLIHSQGQSDLVQYEMPEFATYQTFSIEVVHDGITIQQVDYNLDGTIQDDSAHGCVTIGFAGPPAPKYFNLTIDGAWILTNMPVFPFSGIGEPQAITMDFYLGVIDGTPVSSVMAGFSLDDAPILVAPPGSAFYPVTDLKINMSTGKSVGLMTPDAPARFSASLVEDYAELLATIYNQDCGVNECVPAACSNSMWWLQDKYGIPSSDKDTSITAMKMATGWTSTGCGANWDDIKAIYIASHGFGITNTGIPSNRPVSYSATAADCDTAIQALKDGKDVEIDGLTHVARVVGMAKLSGGSYQITVAHDTNQGNPGGQKIESFVYIPSPGFPMTLGGWGFNGKLINGFVAEK